MTCPICQQHNPEAARFCQNCGGRLVADGIPLPPVSQKSFIRRHKGLLIGLALIFIFFILPIILFVHFISSVSEKVAREEKLSAVVSGKGEDKIALVNIDGVIVEHEPSGGLGVLQEDVTSARKIKKILQEIESNRKVKIVLLRVNSPGGSAVASEEIYQEFLDFKARTGKKVVAYFSDIAASGGYYVAMSADSIVANPSTITGSIGVIVSYLNVKTLAEKLGVKQIVYKSGVHKDILSEFEEPTDDEKKIIQSVVNDSYENFVKAVSLGRHLPTETARTFGDGRIYSAKQAEQLGLIDKIGTFEQAVTAAKTLAKISEAEVIEYGRASFLENFLGNLAPRMTIPFLSESGNYFGRVLGPQILYLYSP